MDFSKIIEKIKGLDEIGKLSLIRYGIFALALIFIIPCELTKGIVLSIFAILFWGLVIAGIVLTVIVKRKKKQAKMNKSY